MVGVERARSEAGGPRLFDGLANYLKSGFIGLNFEIFSSLAISEH